MSRSPFGLCVLTKSGAVLCRHSQSACRWLLSRLLRSVVLTVGDCRLGHARAHVGCKKWDGRVSGVAVEGVVVRPLRRRGHPS